MKPGDNVTVVNLARQAWIHERGILHNWLSYRTHGVEGVVWTVDGELVIVMHGEHHAAYHISELDGDSTLMPEEWWLHYNEPKWHYAYAYFQTIS